MATVRGRWAEGATGTIVIGGATGLLMLPGVLICTAGYQQFGSHPATGVLLLAVGILAALPVVVYGNATSAVFTLAVTGMRRVPMSTGRSPLRISRARSLAPSRARGGFEPGSADGNGPSARQGVRPGLRGKFREPAGWRLVGVARSPGDHSEVAAAGFALGSGSGDARWQRSPVLARRRGDFRSATEQVGRTIRHHAVYASYSAVNRPYSAVNHAGEPDVYGLDLEVSVSRRSTARLSLLRRESPPRRGSVSTRNGLVTGIRFDSRRSSTR